MSSGDRLRMTTAPLLIVSIGFVVGGTTALALYYAGVYQELLRGLAGGRWREVSLDIWRASDGEIA